jgi:hypothetical protein
VTLAPIELSPGERYGHLTVLGKITSDKRGPKYRCGCVCGNRVFAKARQLMRGEVKACARCVAVV